MAECDDVVLTSDQKWEPYSSQYAVAEDRVRQRDNDPYPERDGQARTIGFGAS